MRTYVMPKEIRLKIQNFMNDEHFEGSYWRSGVGRSRYRQLQDDHRYVLFWRSCGKLKTIQQPDGQPWGSYGARVRVWNSRP